MKINSLIAIFIILTMMLCGCHAIYTRSINKKHQKYKLQPKKDLNLKEQEKKEEERIYPPDLEKELREIDDIKKREMRLKENSKTA